MRVAASWLAGQIDYIYFCYGLAFVLLGSVCLTWLRKGTRQFPWLVMALFAFVHGAGEWLELISLSGIDSRGFEIVRALLLGGSMVLLVEFARQTSRVVRGRSLGPWVHGVLGAGVLAAVFSLGLQGLVPSIRLLFATTGAIWSGVLFLAASVRADVPDEGVTGRRALRWAGAAFCAYGLVAGLVVPAGPFFPANRFNQQLFLQATGLPVQLIRALVAIWLTVSIWAYAESLDEQGVVRRKRRIAFWIVLAAVTGVQGAGWSLTEHLGRLDERDFVQEAETDAEGLQDRLLREMRSADEGARAFSSVVSRFRLMDEEGVADPANLDALVDELSFGGADRVVYVLDSTGTCVSTSNRTRPDSFLAKNYAFRPYFVDAIHGQPGQFLGLGVTSRLPGYYASAPVLGEGDRPLGVAVVKHTLATAEFGLARYKNAHLVSPEGRILVSDRPEVEGRMLWPSRPEDRPSSRSPETAAAAPLLDAETAGTEWIRAAQGKQLAVRRTILATGWSIVLLREPRTRSTNRALGIVITILSCALVMTGFAAIQHQFSSESRIIRKEGVLTRLTVKLARKAGTDELTGLCNRLGFDDAMAREVERARRDGTPLSITMLDLDHFKLVNDVHGHQAGDDLLVWVARLLERNVRQTDTVARWGGEEFMIIAPLTPLEGAIRQAEKIRAAFAAAPPGSTGSLTASLGVASLGPVESVEELLRRADEALYRAKTSGRNRVESAA